MLVDPPLPGGSRQPSRVPLAFDALRMSTDSSPLLSSIPGRIALAATVLAAPPSSPRPHSGCRSLPSRTSTRRNSCTITMGPSLPANSSHPASANGRATCKPLKRNLPSSGSGPRRRRSRRSRSAGRAHTHARTLMHAITEPVWWGSDEQGSRRRGSWLWRNDRIVFLR